MSGGCKMRTFGKKMSTEFYTADALCLAKALLGKLLVTVHEGEVTAGIIADTEAYMGTTDRACHAFGGHRSAKNESMYLPGGHAYVYMIYGMYYCVNVTANEKNIPEAVLIRGILPFYGREIMVSRRASRTGVVSPHVSSHIADGPGKLCRAMAIDRSCDALRLDGERIYICDAGLTPTEEVTASERLNIDYAGEDALRPWRFALSQKDPLRRYAAAQ